MFTDNQTLDVFFRILLLGPICVLWVAVVVRVIGVRSFSKMTAFDFVVTVATGSLLATAATSTGWPTYIQAFGSIAVILLFQAAVAICRRKSETFRKLFENEPVLLYLDGEYQTEAMKKTRTARGDIESKLREANVLEKGAVRAVVLEVTGDVSVLHGEKLEKELIESVKRVS